MSNPPPLYLVHILRSHTATVVNIVIKHSNCNSDGTLLHIIPLLKCLPQCISLSSSLKSPALPTLSNSFFFVFFFYHKVHTAGPPSFFLLPVFLVLRASQRAPGEQRISFCLRLTSRLHNMSGIGLAFTWGVARMKTDMAEVVCGLSAT